MRRIGAKKEKFFSKPENQSDDLINYKNDGKPFNLWHVMRWAMEKEATMSIRFIKQMEVFINA